MEFIVLFVWVILFQAVVAILARPLYEQEMSGRVMQEQKIRMD